MKWIVFIYDAKKNKMVRKSKEEFENILNKASKINFTKDWWKEAKEIAEEQAEIYRGAKVFRLWYENYKLHFIIGTNGFNQEIADEMLFFEQNGTNNSSKEIQKKHSWIK